MTNLVVLRDFESAKKYFEETKPVGMRITRPLHRRRREPDKYALVKYSNEVYSVKLYDTYVVSWHSDGRIVIDISYNSQLTNIFARYYLPVGIHVRRFNTFPVVYGYFWEVFATRPITLRLDGSGWAPSKITLVDAPSAKVRKIDRKKAILARKVIKPLLQYAQTIYELTKNNMMSSKQVNYLLGDKKPIFSDVLENSNLWPNFTAYYMRVRNYGPTDYYYMLDYLELEKDVVKKAYDLFDVYYYEKLPLGTLKPKAFPVNN